MVLACRDAGVACESMADLCFQMSPVVAQLLRECARKCEACAEQCGNVSDPRLADLANAAREAARACRCLSWTFWQNLRRNFRAAAKPSAPAAKARRGGKRLARPLRPDVQKRPPAAHRDAG